MYGRNAFFVLGLVLWLAGAASAQHTLHFSDSSTIEKPQPPGHETFSHQILTPESHTANTTGDINNPKPEILPAPAGVIANPLGAFTNDDKQSSKEAGGNNETLFWQPEFEFAEFPEEKTPLLAEILEAPPSVLSWPAEPLADLFARIFRIEHDIVETELDDKPIGLQPIPDRPALILEWNEGFLEPGFLNQGIQLPTGAVWRPALWAFGQYRTAFQYFDARRTIDPIVEIPNRLDLFTQLNLSGTERVLVQFRPLDREERTVRQFTSYDLNNGRWIDGWNGEPETAFFEGDFGEIFPFLDPYDTKFLDYGFSVGRMPLLAQQGLLLNEDLIDALTVTRNTLYGQGNLNLRVSGVYAWNRISRTSSTTAPTTNDPTSQMIALLTESDFFKRTTNLDFVYVFGDDDFSGDLIAVAASSIRRYHGYHNTYNSSVHILASFPTSGETPFAGQGELLVSQFSWTPHYSHDLIYVNTFYAIDQFTAPARSPAASQFGPLGLLFAARGLGRIGPQIASRPNDVGGAVLGYQFFYDHTRQQIIWEVGGQKETQGPSRGAIATGLRYQKAIGQHYVFTVEGSVGKREGVNTSSMGRTEFLIRF